MRVTRRAAVVLACLAMACAAPHGPPATQPSADALALRAQSSFDAGNTQGGLELATRALIVRVARHGIEHPEAAKSFLQLGDMRRALGQLGWAKQSYRRGLEVIAAHRDSNDGPASSSTSAALERTLRSRLREVSD